LSSSLHNFTTLLAPIWANKLPRAKLMMQQQQGKYKLSFLHREHSWRHSTEASSLNFWFLVCPWASSQLRGISHRWNIFGRVRTNYKDIALWLTRACFLTRWFHICSYHCGGSGQRRSYRIHCNLNLGRSKECAWEHGTSRDKEKTMRALSRHPPSLHSYNRLDDHYQSRFVHLNVQNNSYKSGLLTFLIWKYYMESFLSVRAHIHAAITDSMMLYCYNNVLRSLHGLHVRCYTT
jgi:hypothetical protein